MIAAILAVAQMEGSFVSPASAASFNCAVDRNPDEVAVCKSPVLSQLDEQVADLFKRDLAVASNREAFRQTQREFLRHRAECGSDAGCLERLYRERIAALSGAPAQAPEQAPKVPPQTDAQPLPAGAAAASRTQEAVGKCEGVVSVSQKIEAVSKEASGGYIIELEASSDACAVAFVDLDSAPPSNCTAGALLKAKGKWYFNGTEFPELEDAFDVKCQ